MATTPIWGMTIPTGNDANGATLADILVFLEALATSRLLDRDVTTPPGSPSEGDMVHVAASSTTGVFVGQEGKLAFYWNGEWRFSGVVADITKAWTDEQGNGHSGPHDLVARDDSAWTVLGNDF